MSSTPQFLSLGSDIYEAMSVSSPFLSLDQESANTVILHRSQYQDPIPTTDEPIFQQEDRTLYFNSGNMSMVNELFPESDRGHNVSSYDQQNHIEQYQLQPLLQDPLLAGDEEYTNFPNLAQPYSAADYLQTVDQVAQPSQLQSGSFPPSQNFFAHSTPMAPATPFFTSPLHLESTVHLLYPETAEYLSNYLETTCSEAALQSSPFALYGSHFEQSLDTEFSNYRSPAFDRLSSPDDCSSILSASESPSDQGCCELSDVDAYAISIALSGSSLSGTSSSAPPSPALLGESFVNYGHHSGVGDDLTGPFGDLGVTPLGSSTSTMAGSSGIASPKGKIRSHRSQQLAAGSTPPVQVPYVSSYVSTTPTQSSALKQQFSSFESDEDQYDNDDEDYEGEDIDGGEEDERPKKKQRKRVRRETEDKPKAPRLILHCDFPGCVVTCASHPSLVRHREAHRWRGQYTPVRCAACQSSLSNEFSVQRHIMRSPESSRCRRMRVYNMMGSETSILRTVRFYPDRGHGRKTVHVDLEKMKEKYP